MKCGFKVSNFAQMAVLAFSMVAMPNMVAQQVPSAQDLQEAAQRAQYQQKLQQVIGDMSGHATAIVRRWEQAAILSGRWDQNYQTDLYNALMKLQPDNLLAAGEAPSYDAMMRVLATGQSSPQTKLLSAPPDTTTPALLGSFSSDLVFTPVTPCRIIDTRSAGGIMAANTTRTFDVDGSSFSTQGVVAPGVAYPSPWRQRSP